MLQITIPAIELFDDTTQEFVNTKEQTLQLEHSLVSISKWESKWLKPFMTKDKKTNEETTDYIRCMTITQNVDNSIYNYIDEKTTKEISDYIKSPMTSMTFTDTSKHSNRETITSELIYYWMIAMNIPLECQKWHLNRLLTLINVCNIKNSPPKKVNRTEQLERNRQLNAERRKQLNSNG